MDEPLAMLTAEIKQRINTCRDILVGKVPDPKSQVLQITNALIYKFMDDQDRLAESLGGKPSFYINGLKPYAWHKLFDPKLTNQERADKYVEGIEKLSEAKHLPELFREIFKEAYVPFRAANVITLFITEINKFDYTHSEELGNAYEYLLSIMGSQGDAGQFRTPRHIIEFLVDVVDPQKGDSMYDPAAGTAGFLIAAYNHILAANEKLSAGEKRALGKNISGVDISPDMANMARVNLYLHGFATPNILEGDTLTDEHLWGSKYDVILANPPFMSPKGGISPHNLYAVKSRNSEILFVEYILEHLRLGGRAGVIVPDGVIFKSNAAYAAVRKLLIDRGLYAVVSLPAGVFGPYSKTTKTSIIFVDRNLEGKDRSVLFVQVDNDGFDLGADRRPIKENDLPEAVRLVKEFRRTGTVKSKTTLHHVVESPDALKSRPGANLAVLHDYAANGSTHHAIVRIGDILIQRRDCLDVEDDIEYKQVTVKINRNGAVLRDVKSGTEIGTKRQYVVKAGDFVMSKIDARNGAFAIIPSDLEGAIVTQDFPVFTVNTENMREEFLPLLMHSPEFLDICQRTSIGTSNRRRISLTTFLQSTIPLPLLDAQDDIIVRVKAIESQIKTKQKELTELHRQHAEICTEVWGSPDFDQLADASAKT